MTHEDIKEALEWCEKQLEIRRTIRCNGRTLLCTIGKALEKQTPKKPTDLVKKDNEVHYICSNCEMSWGHACMSVVKYCPNCGQAIDWSEEE